MRLRSSIALVVAVSCGPSSPRTTAPDRMLDKPAGPSSKPPTEVKQSTPKETIDKPLPELSIHDACERFRTLTNDSCDWTKRFPAEFSGQGVCERNLEAWLDPASGKRDEMLPMINCWALDCEPAANCMMRVVLAQRSEHPPQKRNCGDEGTTAVEVDAATWDARRGVSAKRFSEVKTSVAEPIEVCGIPGEIEWMSRVTCDDGTNPYASPAAVNDGRDPWFDSGGRCNSILDRYSVACPEATYTIHIDRYICPQSAAEN